MTTLVKAAEHRGPIVVRRWEVLGTVQGVGFRPFVHRLATALDLVGSVRNDGGTVVIAAAGDPAKLDEFLIRLRGDAPPLAAVTEIVEQRADADWAVPDTGFTIEASRPGPGAADRGQAEFAEIPPDAAVCDACLTELFDPDDRRHHYPFVNCTNCGPRATIIDDLPYDRARTSMASFPLCTECAAEYHEPTNRRFHAEPVACPVCGPTLSWHAISAPTAEGEAVGASALALAVDRLDRGGIIAVKGLGGYQLVCDATDEAAVQRLRQGKRRPRKPFAVMVADLAAVRALACVTSVEERLLASVARPVVLVRPWPEGSPRLADGVAPDVPRLGLFLPTTPLHHLLLRAAGKPLIVTSGNVAGAPIVIDDSEAVERLGLVCEGLLRHDRPIRARYDDSVTRVVAGRAMVVRRARGYAPAALDLPVPAPRPLLAVGAQLKHTFTLAVGGHAVVGPHTGDLEDAETMAAFEESVSRMERIHHITPVLVAHDLHPDYLSTQVAALWPADRRIGVQHHHAHIASCAAEHGVTEPVLGVAYDGLGLGADGTLWGGEVLLADLRTAKRLARFGTAPMPGGASAVRKPPRMALGYLAGGEDLGGRRPSEARLRDFAADVGKRDQGVETVLRLARTGIASPRISSAGRFFDAAAAILGLCDDAGYEGEAAVRLEAAAQGAMGDPLPWRVVRSGGLWVLDCVTTLTALLDAVADRGSVPELAAAFHDALVAATLDLVVRCSQETGVRTVCLSGGVWQNQRLAEASIARLADAGFRVLINERVPCNDGGISYGQAAIAAARTTDR
jgi:hydrogenase maturation protein HypF